MQHLFSLQFIQTPSMDLHPDKQKQDIQASESFCLTDYCIVLPTVFHFTKNTLFSTFLLLAVIWLEISLNQIFYNIAENDPLDVNESQYVKQI